MHQRQHCNRNSQGCAALSETLSPGQNDGELGTDVGSQPLNFDPGLGYPFKSKSKVSQKQCESAVLGLSSLSEQVWRLQDGNTNKQALLWQLAEGNYPEIWVISGNICVGRSFILKFISNRGLCMFSLKLRPAETRPLIYCLTSILRRHSLGLKSLWVLRCLIAEYFYDRS